jgi:hypothetical protein
MKFKIILSESLRNFQTGTSKVIISAVIFLLTAGTLVGLDLFSVAQIVSEVDAYQARGANIYTLSTTKRINGVVCDDLKRMDNVIASGAIRSSRQSYFSKVTPNSPITVKEITPGAYELFSGQPFDRGGVLVSEQVLEALRLKIGDQLNFGNLNTSVSGTYAYPNDGRQPDFSYNILGPVSADQNFDLCWVQVWPIFDGISALLQMSMVSPSGAVSNATEMTYNITQLNAGNEPLLDPAAKFYQRPTLWVFLIAALIGLGLGFFLTYVRKLEIASALHVNATKKDLLAIHWLDALTWSTLGTLAIIPITAYFALFLGGSDPLSLILLSLKIISFEIIGILLGVFLAILLVKEKHYYRYFVTR